MFSLPSAQGEVAPPVIAPPKISDSNHSTESKGRNSNESRRKHSNPEPPRLAEARGRNSEERRSIEARRNSDAEKKRLEFVFYNYL